MKNKSLIKKLEQLFFLGLIFLSPAFLLAAGETEVVEATTNNTLFISRIIVIVVSILSIGFVSWKFYKVPSKNQEERDVTKKGNFLDLFGAYNTEDEIKKLDLHHDYDGIRELDNKIPGWWNLAFAGTVLIAIIYAVRFFVIGTFPDQIDELKESQRIADIKVQKYLESSGGLVDENTAVMSDAAGIKQGGDLYSAHCVACHGASGEGGIGPNLTDEYWLHKGGVKDVFYSIKYGWPDQGMMPWKDSFSPIEIQNISSYILSLQGTNPAGAKEPQGEVYKEE